MKRILTLTSASLMIAMLIVTGCSKKKDPTPTKTQLLTRANGWKQSASSAGIEDCDKDDTIKFTTAGVFTQDEGATKCDEDSDQTTSGTWAFNAGETIINVTQDDTTIPVTILQLDATTLKISITFGSDTSTETYTGI